jgi:type I restriction enzyme S subunit
VLQPSSDIPHKKQVQKMPNNWEICKLSDICIFERGITFPSSAKQTTKLPNTIPCVRTANVQENLELNDLMIIRAYKVNSKYIFYFLRDCFYKGLFASIATQTTNIANINTAVLGEMDVFIPPLPEQKRIVQRIETIFQALDSIQNNL